MNMKCKTFTHIPPEYTFEDLTADTSDAGRFYDCPIGSLPSVTTVTGWEKNKFFAKWRRENPTEARRVTDRGNVLHAVIEDYLNNEFDRSKCSDDVFELFMQLKPELDKIDNIQALEVPLWSEATMLAGRVDCVGEYNGKLSIIDFKGCTRAKTQKDVDNYFLQATAYAIAWQERTGKAIDRFSILMSCEDGITQVFEGNPVHHAKKLLEAIEKYHQANLV
tara:strand:- start:612 stop:1274 length:663 start_codon:yes stop_codon:yes gene_type:complete